MRSISPRLALVLGLAAGPEESPYTSIYQRIRELQRSEQPDEQIRLRRFQQMDSSAQDSIAFGLKEYLELVDPGSFQPIGRITGPVIAAGALWVGSTRLIDNLLCDPP